MNVFRKVLAILTIVLAIIFLIVSLAGIGGVWVIRERVNTAITNLFTLADGSITRLNSGIGEVISLSGEVEGVVTAMEVTIETLGAKIEETPVVLLAVDALFDGKLVPGLTKFNQASQKFYTGLVQLQTIVDGMNASFLFRRQDGALDKISVFLDTFVPTLEQLDQDVNDLTTGVQEAKAGATEKVVDRLTRPLGRIATLMSNTQDRLNDVEDNLSDLQVSLDAAEAKLIRLITLVVTLITLILLWIALSQVIVIRWGIDYYKAARLSSAPPQKALSDAAGDQPEGASGEPLPAADDLPAESDQNLNSGEIQGN